MRLPRRALLIIVLAPISLTLIVYFLASNILLDGYVRIEEQQIRLNVYRALNAQNQLLASLASKNGDWSVWNETFAEPMQTTLTMFRFDEAQLPPDAQSARETLVAGANLAIQPLNDQSIAGYVLLKDIYDQPALFVRVEMPRDVYAQGQTTLKYLLGSLLIVGLIFGIAIQFLVSKLTDTSVSYNAHMYSASLINQISNTAATALDLRSTLQMLANELGSLLNADGCYITLWDESNLYTIPTAAYGDMRAIYPQRRSTPGQLTMTESVLQAGHPLIAEDVFHTPYMSPQIAAKYPTRSLLALPLIAGNHKLGAVLIAFNHTHHFTSDEVERASEAMGPIALAIAKAKLFDELKQSHRELEEAYERTLEGWVRALDLRDPETEGHSRRVVELTTRLARTLRVPEEQVTHIRRGALLHDIGKLGVPDQILLKPGPLTEAERTIMQRHTKYGYELVSSIEYLRPAAVIPYCHHEKWDGNGYPRGLKGAAIPFAARLFAIVDVWDALTNDRPYRSALSPDEARAYLSEQAGKYFDPQAVVAFLQTLEQDQTFNRARNDAPASLTEQLGISTP